MKGMDPVALIKFENGSYNFNIGHPGFYSIAILGGGFVKEARRVNVELTSNDSHPVEVRTNNISFRFLKEKQIGTDHWGFSAQTTGNYTIVFSSLENLEVKKSMLWSKRLFESNLPADHIKILIYKTTMPLYRLAAIVSLVFGIGLILSGILLNLNV